jgi:CheY-like chemotaxis protein
MEKICIVDDYDINIFVLKEYLQDKYEIISFSKAKSCIEYLKTNKVKVVLMDCIMPIMDGYEATEIIKKELGDVKIIGVTANPFEDNIEKCKKSGMDNVVIKPIIMEDLLAKIEAVSSV